MAVDVSPVPDAGNGDLLLRVVHQVERPVVPDPEAVAFSQRLLEALAALPLGLLPRD